MYVKVWLLILGCRTYIGEYFSEWFAMRACEHFLDILAIL